MWPIYFRTRHKRQYDSPLCPATSSVLFSPGASPRKNTGSRKIAYGSPSVVITGFPAVPRVTSSRSASGSARYACVNGSVWTEIKLSSGVVCYFYLLLHPVQSGLCLRTCVWSPIGRKSLSSSLSSTKLLIGSKCFYRYFDYVPKVGWASPYRPHTYAKDQAALMSANVEERFRSHGQNKVGNLTLFPNQEPCLKVSNVNRNGSFAGHDVLWWSILQYSWWMLLHNWISIYFVVLGTEVVSFSFEL